MPRRVNVVPHTHWDREWYAPFQTFRMRLVELLDDLLPRLDADPGYAHFLLDGQMAVVDDYLAMRPQAETALRRLATSGRLAMGPWYILMDEFLVSGETMVRNLQLGLDRAAAFGGAMEVGYLPDMFGHIAQMPQLLRQFGFDHAVVWRGVPSAIDRTGFWWRAPDGSEVRAEYLPTGYGNGASMPPQAKEVLERLRAWEADHGTLLGAAAILWMNGSDHQTPQAHLGRLVAEVNALAGGDLDMRVTSLAEHVRTAPVRDLPSWTGELRSGARANLLMGVTSNRVDVRRAAARAETALERLAEPLTALFAPADQWPQALLDEAWLMVVRNSAHDSVCACSDDEVVDAVLHRYAEARQIGEGVAGQAVRIAGALTSAVGPLVVNPVARTRGGVVPVTVLGETAPEGAQLVRAEPLRRVLLDLPAASAVTVLGEIVGWTPGLSSSTVELHDDGSVEVVVFADGTPGEPAERSALTARVDALVAGRPSTRVRAWLQQIPSVRVLTRVEDVPGFGWRAHAGGPPAVPAAVADGHTVGNGLVTVTADPSDGTFAIDGLSGFGRLVDEGDVGDTYNWCPPADDVVVSTPATVAVRSEGGPLVARLEIRRTFAWPAGTPRRAAPHREGEVVTEIEVHAGDPAVRMTVTIDNPCDDHRLRMLLPLPSPAVVSRAECAFTVVERGLVAEGGPTEESLATFPSRRFVQAGGLTLAHEGVTEYELVDLDDGAAEPSSRTLAVTLLRASGWLSQGPMATRPLPAGPVHRLRGSQMRGLVERRFSIALGDVDPFALADDLLVPLQVTYGAGLGTLPPVHQVLSVDGAEVSSLRRRAGGLELRVFNPTGHEVGVTVEGRS
ncbi:MAG TPA: hypothetical protein VF855_11805, partial [Acidimicrobiales bacterium]